MRSSRRRGFSGDVVLHTRTDAGGAFIVDRADASMEIEVEEKVAALTWITKEGEGDKDELKDELEDAPEETKTRSQARH